tara:strand:+ start:828 stop:1040 length:213 start_codon:yes stop_codon:yes gene_type:complete
MDSLDFTVGDFVEFSGYYEKLIDNNKKEIVMSSCKRKGIIVEAKSGTVKIFSEEDFYIVRIVDSVHLSRI